MYLYFFGNTVFNKNTVEPQVIRNYKTKILI